MSDPAPTYPTIEDVIGATPMVRLVRAIPGVTNAGSISQASIFRNRSYR